MSRETWRKAVVEVIGALVLPALAVMATIAFNIMVKNNAPWAAYLPVALVFISIAWTVKANASNIKLTANIGK
jgi:hypothetical protein